MTSEACYPEYCTPRTSCRPHQPMGSCKPEPCGPVTDCNPYCRPAAPMASCNPPCGPDYCRPTCAPGLECTPFTKMMECAPLGPCGPSCMPGKECHPFEGRGYRMINDCKPLACHPDCGPGVECHPFGVVACRPGCPPVHECNPFGCTPAMIQAGCEPDEFCLPITVCRPYPMERIETGCYPQCGPNCLPMFCPPGASPCSPSYVTPVGLQVDPAHQFVEASCNPPQCRPGYCEPICRPDWEREVMTVNMEYAGCEPFGCAPDLCEPNSPCPPYKCDPYTNPAIAYCDPFTCGPHGCPPDWCTPNSPCKPYDSGQSFAMVCAPYEEPSSPTKCAPYDLVTACGPHPGCRPPYCKVTHPDLVEHACVPIEGACKPNYCSPDERRLTSCLPPGDCSPLCGPTKCGPNTEPYRPMDCLPAWCQPDCIPAPVLTRMCLPDDVCPPYYCPPSKCYPDRK
jgi:hypothetical protein